MPVSGRIDRRERQRNRELSLLVNSPGWTAAADHVLQTPGSEVRVTGRRTSMYLVKQISPRRTRRQSTALTFSELPPATPKGDEPSVNESKPRSRKDDKKSKLTKLEEKEKSEQSDASQDEAPPSKKTRVSKPAPKKAKESKDKKENTKKSEKKVVASRGKSSIPKPVKQKSESRSTQRRNARLRPFSKQLPKSPDQSPKHILREKVAPENGVHEEDSEDVKHALSKSATIRMKRLDQRVSQDDERENEASMEESAILDTSAADSANGSMLNDSKSRCHIL